MAYCMALIRIVDIYSTQAFAKKRFSPNAPMYLFNSEHIVMIQSSIKSCRVRHNHIYGYKFRPVGLMPTRQRTKQQKISKYPYKYRGIFVGAFSYTTTTHYMAAQEYEKSANLSIVLPESLGFPISSLAQLQIREDTFKLQLQQCLFLQDQLSGKRIGSPSCGTFGFGVIRKALIDGVEMPS